jgi:hypothetical protein
MRNGSSAHDGDGWPSEQRPYRDDDMSGPGPYGPGRRSEPQEISGGRREAPFGPDISWPNGFRKLDTGARRLLEAGYGSSGYGRDQHDRVGPGYGAGGRGSGYRQPDPSSPMDDYGDPGYSDPAYDGPRSGSGGRGRPGDNRGPRSSPLSDGPGYGGMSGYHAPDYREPARPDPGYQQDYTGSHLYPVTGEQEALPATGPQPIADSWPGRDAGSAGSGPQAYPEQWYGYPQLNDPRDGGTRPDSPPAADPHAARDPRDPRDPRLEGMRYDELRYEEPSGYDEPLDDDSWVEELRRSAPAYPQATAGRPGGDRRRSDPRGTGYDQPGRGSHPGSGQPGSYPGFGYGQGRDDRSGSGPMSPAAPRGPMMSAGPEARPRTPGGLQDYLGAPTAQVGVLTPPPARRLEDPAATGPQPVILPAAAAPAAADAGQVLAPSVRPGHGLDGPEITSSWPTQPQADELESFEEFWAQDDDEDYSGLFPGEDPDSDSRRASGGRNKGNARRTGRRRGRSRDHRLWLALLGVLVAAAAAIFGILKFEFPSHNGPVHAMATPARIGSYVRTVDMEKQTKVSELRAEVIKMSSGQASNVVSAVYESGNSAAGGTEQIVMFIGGHLANAAPASSIASFTQNFAGATVVSAGSLGGKGACVEKAPGTSDSVAMCVWFDNDSFGEIVSPTMNATSLANVMRTMRPSLEVVVKN